MIELGPELLRAVLVAIVAATVGGFVSGVVSFITMQAQMKYLERDISNLRQALHSRIDEVQRAANKAHSRIDNIFHQR